MLRTLAICLIIASGVLAGTASAGAVPASFEDRIVLAADNGAVSLDQAIRNVRREFGDVTILKAETRGKGDRAEHRIKFLTPEGRVRTVRVSARNGRIR
jgi:uncharacterized membrane protein YkoI